MKEKVRQRLLYYIDEGHYQWAGSVLLNFQGDKKLREALNTDGDVAKIAVRKQVLIIENEDILLTMLEEAVGECYH